MKIFLVQIKFLSCLGLLIFTSPYLLAQSKQAIEVKEAYKYVGETQIVCGRIVSKKIFKKSFWRTNFFKFWKRLSQSANDRSDMVW